MNANAVRFYFVVILFWVYSASAATGVYATAPLSQIINSVEFKLAVTDFEDVASLRSHFQKTTETLYTLNPFQSLNSVSQAEIEIFSKKLKSVKEAVKQLTYAFSAQTTDSFARDQLADDAKSFLTAIRVFEDRMLEWRFFKLNPPKTIFKRIAPFRGHQAIDQVRDGDTFGLSDLRAGDVIVTRSSRLLSSMIARMTDAQMSYSHMGIVVVDPKDGKKYIIDSNLNAGFQKVLLDESFYKDEVRVAVYRSKQGFLGSLASEYGRFAYESNLQKGTPLEYDITMSLEPNCKFYCSKFVAWTYNSVSDKDSIPQYPSKLQGNNKNFIAALGVPSSARYTFAPSDIELDSMFDIIYEYRNPGLTAQSRLEELVVDKVLYWIRTEGLEISPSTLTERGAKVAIKVYQIPSIRRVLNSLNMHLNPNLDPKFLSVGITMKLLVESIRAKVEKLVKNSVTGVYSSPSEIYQMIDEARLETPNFARLLKPRKQNACMRFYTSYNVR